jgi:hypothetical protein
MSPALIRHRANEAGEILHVKPRTPMIAPRNASCGDGRTSLNSASEHGQGASKIVGGPDSGIAALGE